MKRLFTILATVLLTVTVFSQSPEKMSYQAVIRDGSNALIANQAVGMQISILQGSINGTAVYVETQTPTTNANGLVSIEIGAGTAVSGNFANINWANDSYFVKTETDPSGATSYTITGTSQLLSVPYALHAKTAESVSGGGGNTHYVGELYGGGVVFWVDHTGEHGLILSLKDLTTGVVWSDVESTLVGTSDWDGAGNTFYITMQSGHTTGAAKLCEDYTNDDYGTGIYSDWYLPSIAELNHVWNNFYDLQKAITDYENSSVPPIRQTYYWSSTELNASRAWRFSFGFGYTGYGEKNTQNYVRAVRAF